MSSLSQPWVLRVWKSGGVNAMPLGAAVANLRQFHQAPAAELESRLLCGLEVETPKAVFRLAGEPVRAAG